MSKATEAAWLTIPQAVEMLNASGIKMSAPTLLTLIKEETVDGMKLGNRYFILKETIEKILKGEYKQKRKVEDESK